MSTFVCIASGPSLTKEDCELVKQWREGGSDRHVVVVNNTYQIAPWADTLVAVDDKWWATTLPEFAGDKICVNNNKYSRQVKMRGRPRNSGVAAIMYAHLHNADKIILLGYDLKYRADGLRHWHGDHVQPLGNAESIGRWHSQFEYIVSHLQFTDVINCTRDTALNIWRTGRLEDELC